MAIDIENLTLAEIRQIAALAAPFAAPPVQIAKPKGEQAPYVVCTDKRGVIFGYTDDTEARPIVLTSARMCLYWSADVGGVFGLAEVGPNWGCNISAVVPSITLEGVTAIMTVDPAAEKAWVSAKVKGR